MWWSTTSGRRSSVSIKVSKTSYVTCADFCERKAVESVSSEEILSFCRQGEVYRAMVPREKNRPNAYRVSKAGDVYKATRIQKKTVGKRWTILQHTICSCRLSYVVLCHNVLYIFLKRLDFLDLLARSRVRNAMLLDEICLLVHVKWLKLATVPR